MSNLTLRTLIVLLVTSVAAAPTARAQANEARALALEALRLEFEQDNLAATSEDLTRRFKDACERGYNPACRRGNWLVDGKADLQKAADVLRPSCDVGDAVACLVVGWALDAEAQEERIEEEQVRIWRRAARLLKDQCDSGFAYACHDYAYYLYENKGLTLPNARPAIDAWNKACDAGVSASCVQLARLKRDGSQGVSRNVGHAVQYARMACEKQADPDGCYVLGRLQDDRWSTAQFDQYYDKLCTLGHKEACWYLARAYYDGRHMAPSPTRTQELFERGCAINHARACFEAGRWETETDGDVAKAARLFGAACELGDAAGCSAQVDMILSGQVQGDVHSAYAAFDVACEQGQSIDACAALGRYLLDDKSTPRDPARGRELLGRVCVSETSETEACFILGQLHEQGIGGDQDRTDAARFYQWACDQGYVDACMRRGKLLVPDIGIRADHNEALRMFGLTCDAGVAQGCYEAGELLETSPHIKDLGAALEWYRRGCAADHAEACVGLGRTLESPDGGRDVKAAREAYERGVELGGDGAKRELARMLWNGIGGSKKKGRARRLAREACSEGDSVACKGAAFLK